MRKYYFGHNPLKGLSFKPSHSYDYGKILVNSAIMLWCLSLCLPALTAGTETYYGYRVLVEGILLGWFGFIFQPYSNLTFWLVMILIWRGKTPIGLAWVNFLLSASSFLLTTLPVGGDKGVADVDVTWQVGAILWIASYVVLLLGCILRSQHSTPT